MAWELWLYLALSAAGALLGFVAGRRTGNLRARIVDLEERLEVLGKEQERSLAELEARRNEALRLREDLSDYRGKVAAHFAGASDLLRELTLQYRAVYDHLAQGASSLCPEGAAELAGSLRPESLPGAGAAAEQAPAAGESAGNPADEARSPRA